MTEQYYDTPFTTTGGEVAVESGRLVLLPVACKMHRAMDEFCLYAPLTYGKLYVYASIVRHPTRAKKRRIASIEVLRDGAVPSDESMLLGHVWGTLRMLFIGDATFFYAQGSDEGERRRVMDACKKDSKPGGSYRCANGQVGVSIRLGDKDLRLTSTMVWRSAVNSPDESPVAIRLSVPDPQEHPSD